MKHSFSTAVDTTVSGVGVERQRPKLSAFYLQSVVGTLAVGVLGVVSGIISSRVLGASGRGELTALLLVPGLAARLGGFGLTQSVGHLNNPVRRQDASVGPSAVGLALLLGSIQLSLLTPCLTALAPSIAVMQPAATICLLWIPANLVLNVVLGIDLSNGDFFRYNLAQFLNAAFYVVLLTSITFVGSASAKVFALSIVVAVVMVLAVRWRTLQQCWGLPDPKTMKAVLVRGWNYSKPELASFSLLRVDTLLLVRLVSTEQLGIYTVALTVAMGQALTANPIAQVCFHNTNSATAADPISSLLRQFRLLQVVFVAVALVSMIAARYLVAIVFGRDFVQGSHAMYVLILSMAVWSCSQVLEGGLRGLDRTRLCTVSNITGLVVVGLAFNSAVTHFGITGMASVMALGQIASLAVKLVYLQRETRCHVRRFWGLNSATIADIKGIASRLLPSAT